MSTKKDKFSKKDKLYMELALDLAKSREGHTGPNPSVGCVVVKNDKIISIGQTSPNGRPHAEYNAINNCHENMDGSKMYVTLEPCAMCAALISASRIRRLYYGASDIKSGGVEQGARIFSHSQTHHRPEIYPGICEEEVVGLMSSFFGDLRH